MAGPTDMVGQLFIIASDKTQIEVGETVHFSISYDENRPPENDINIFINNDYILTSLPVTPSPVLFNYTFEEEGVFLLYATTVGTPESNTIAINVDEATPQTQSNSVSWIINNKTVSSLKMNNKEIQSIVTSDNIVLYNINSSGYDAISLSSDKNILSYADNESCTLTAQLTKNGSPSPVEGETVSFYNGATLLGTDDTDSNGIATLTYTSAGVGDMTLTAGVDSIISSETYVEDWWLYKTSIPSYSRTTIASNVYKDVFNSPINLPSTFELEVEFTQSTRNNFITVMIGETSSNYYYNGFGNNKQLTIAISRNNSRSSLVDDGRTGLVTDTIKIGYDGTQMYCTANSHTITNNNSEFNLEKFLGLLWGGSSTIHSIKVKPLRPFNNISLTSDKNILSYADSDTCTLTAQLTDDGSPVSVEGVTVEFFNGSTSLGTADTNSSGIATKVYTSTGSGDMSITASVDGIIISETFSIRDFTYIADTMEKLATALINVTTGNSIYLKDGTYSLPSNYTVSGIKLIGESTNAKIVSSDGQINFTDSIVDTIGMETVNVNRPVIYVDGTTTVKNCDCVSEIKPWDAAVISVNLNNPDGLITIHDCYFHGNAKSNGFGHSCGAITGQGSVAYNVIIHHNTFNHPCNSDQLHGGNKGKAVCFYNGGSTTGTLNNVHLYCNEYLGCGDTNITVSEEICPDN